MKKIITAVVLATTLISAPAFAKAKHAQANQAAGATYTQDSSNFQNQWNDGNW